MNGNFLGIGQDLATNASVQIDQSQPYGILITNGEFTSFCDDGFAPPSCKNPRQVVVGPNNNGAVKFVNSAFWGPTSSIGIIDGKGTTTFSQCHFDSWDNFPGPNKTRLHNGTAAIQQYGGKLIVTQSEFSMQGHGDGGKLLNHFWLGPNVQKTIVSENIVKGVLSVENKGKGKMIVVNNADDSVGGDEL